MAKQVTITFNNEKYVLEFNKDSVRKMEALGFNINKALETPLSSVETLFTGAFIANHGRAIKNRIPEKILAKGLPKGMFEKLVEMYNEPLEAMFEQDDTAEGNLEWGANW